MRKIDIAVAVFFIAVVTALVLTSVSGAVKQETEPASKAEIETRLTHTAAAPKAEVRTESFTALTETATESVQPAFEAEPEEVITEAENTPETAENAPETKEPVSKPESIPGEDATFAGEDTTSVQEDTTFTQEDTTFTEEEPASTEQNMTFFATCTISGYCSCPECAGVWAGGPTASGAYPTDGWTCASNSLPFGTIVYIEGIGTRCVEDRGDSIMDDTWIDLFFGNHDSAQNVGLQYRDVYIVG